MLALSAFGLLPAGCLVAETPDYGPPRQTAPVVDPKTITPNPLYQFATNFTTDVTEVNLVVTSEDAGEELTAVVYVDYGAPDPREVYVRDFDIAPRPFDQPKTVSFQFTPNRSLVSPGCHTLTVLLMHESTYDSFKQRPIPDPAGDLTQVTWFFFAKDDAIPGVSVPCPNGPDPTTVDE